MEGMIMFIVLLVVFLFLTVRQVRQYERKVLYTFGKYTRILTP